MKFMKSLAIISTPVLALTLLSSSALADHHTKISKNGSYMLTFMNATSNSKDVTDAECQNAVGTTTLKMGQKSGMIGKVSFSNFKWKMMKGKHGIGSSYWSSNYTYKMENGKTVKGMMYGQGVYAKHSTVAYGAYSGQHCKGYYKVTLNTTGH